MCQMSVKLPTMFDQNHPHTFGEIVKKLITRKKQMSRSQKKSKANDLGNKKTCHPQKI